jgi:hypothetical protein
VKNCKNDKRDASLQVDHKKSIWSRSEAVLHQGGYPASLPLPLGDGERKGGESFSLYNASNEPIAAFWSLIFVSAQIFCR